MTSSTFKNILQLENLKNLKSFCLIKIHEIVNVEHLSVFLKSHKEMKIRFEFHDSVSEEYKLQLDSLVDTVIEWEDAEHLIVYDGQDDDKYDVMDDRYFDDDE
uniref:Uncharacterized protein n=1 Tax=Panagrolaimus sp. ES5 TaxID=591445 RepID=A0AC34F9N1_9BILA